MNPTDFKALTAAAVEAASDVQTKLMHSRQSRENMRLRNLLKAQGDDIAKKEKAKDKKHAAELKRTRNELRGIFEKKKKAHVKRASHKRNPEMVESDLLLNFLMDSCVELGEVVGPDAAPEDSAAHCPTSFQGICEKAGHFVRSTREEARAKSAGYGAIADELFAQCSQVNVKRCDALAQIEENTHPTWSGLRKGEGMSEHDISIFRGLGHLRQFHFVTKLSHTVVGLPRPVKQGASLAHEMYTIFFDAQFHTGRNNQDHQQTQLTGLVEEVVHSFSFSVSLSFSLSLSLAHTHNTHNTHNTHQGCSRCQRSA
jgi:hypothetical protein